MGDALTAQTIWLAGDGGDTINAYLARPSDPGARGGVVVIHHMPGWDRATKEITRRFAEMGYDAICPNLHHREAPGAEPDDAAAANRAAGGVPDSRLVGDIAAAAGFLRALDTANGKVGVIGFCSGGRQSVLAACNLALDAAVDCYGARVVGPEQGIEDQLGKLSCPLLGLFGNDDVSPSPEQVDRLEALLREHGKTYRFHRYDGAGHAFFAVDRSAYRVAAAVDGWERITAFFAERLAGGVPRARAANASPAAGATNPDGKE
ncbi:MAG: dienelactone hydrolase family protein [Actinomycetia bacterium]|nr:dienelactone hydrolase family protein [Actinomycetes bacterium]